MRIDFLELILRKSSQTRKIKTSLYAVAVYETVISAVAKNAYYVNKGMVL